jgi:hypothetical protein
MLQLSGVTVTMGGHEQFRYGQGRCNGRIAGVFKPGENRVGKREYRGFFSS